MSAIKITSDIHLMSEFKNWMDYMKAKKTNHTWGDYQKLLNLVSGPYQILVNGEGVLFRTTVISPALFMAAMAVLPTGISLEWEHLDIIDETVNKETQKCGTIN